ncbi:DnaA N-terminal domain-containing protein [bacterium endosymbiont of Pedicinus badii]|uniref:DnaA N-terminal domain-containing protein n=1 Tax=bacterium endosymbiont of Pedicinus badii TaxID=1719126 RepID=UPI0009BA3F94|nr:DnaA N-terminal domain-containing protein [bacterium endosymbiont of Pedicinus badii]OQM34072.1 hypothetical protein AOQ89_01810 [bacterium endosymbiont of Pedicinus badii]
MSIKNFLIKIWNQYTKKLKNKILKKEFDSLIQPIQVEFKKNIFFIYTPNFFILKKIKNLYAKNIALFFKRSMKKKNISLFFTVGKKNSDLKKKIWRKKDHLKNY